MALRSPKSLLGALGLGCTLFACAQIAGVRDAEDTAPPGSSNVPDIDPADIVITPDALDLGSAKCGVDGTKVQTITIHNAGKLPAPFAIVLPKDTPFHTKDTLTGTLNANATATVDVVGNPPDAGDASADILVSVGPVAKTVHAKVTGTGPSIRVSPSFTDFGSVRYQAGSAPISVEIENTGSDPLVIPRFVGQMNDFAVSWPSYPSPLRIGPNEKGTMTVTLVSGGLDAAPLDVKITPQPDGAVCGGIPTIEATGQRLNLEVTLSVVDFGQQQCATTPTTTADLVVSNYSNKPLHAAATLKAGSAFAFVGPSAVDVVASTGAPVDGHIPLKLNALPSTLAVIQEDVAVEVDATSGTLGPPNGGPRIAQARVDVHGAIVSTKQSSLSFSAQCGKRGCLGDSKNYDVTNTGNDAITLDWTFARTAGSAAWQYATVGTLAPGQTKTATVLFLPPDKGHYAATLSSKWKSGGNPCAGVPVIGLDGTAN